ncbi:hypothetical protein ACTXT7_008397 [Hymenolepis weldensis]
MESVNTHDAWAMTSDQKAYYLAQFLRLQHDPSGYLSGQAAKAFFELSKLPVSNLSQIWELSDVDADGQLSLSEFSVAMHLVVLCRNGVILPTQLPESLLRVATSSALSTPVPPQPPNKPPSPTPVEGFYLIYPPSASITDPTQATVSFDEVVFIYVLHCSGYRFHQRGGFGVMGMLIDFLFNHAPPAQHVIMQRIKVWLEKSPSNLPTTAVERRSKLGEHRSFDSTLSEFTITTGVTSHRRWSASSPSTDTDGITSFDGRLVPNDQVRHPIAIRANPAPLNSGTLPTAPRAPTPPPRARAKTLTSDTVSRPHPNGALYSFIRTTCLSSTKFGLEISPDEIIWLPKSGQEISAFPKSDGQEFIGEKKRYVEMEKRISRIPSTISLPTLSVNDIPIATYLLMSNWNTWKITGCLAVTAPLRLLRLDDSYTRPYRGIGIGVKVRRSKICDLHLNQDIQIAPLPSKSRGPCYNRASNSVSSNRKLKCHWHSSYRAYPRSSVGIWPLAILLSANLAFGYMCIIVILRISCWLLGEIPIASDTNAVGDILICDVSTTFAFYKTKHPFSSARGDLKKVFMDKRTRETSYQPKDEVFFVEAWLQSFPE